MKKFKVRVGYSDHTDNNISSMIAATHGARVIEKHITNDKNSKSLDSFFSYDLSEFENFVTDIRLAEKSLGKVDYAIAKSCKKSAKNKRSLYVSEDIKKGDKITKKSLQ